MKRFIRLLFISITVILILLYLLSCLTTFISPERWAMLGFLALAFPVMLAAMMGLALVWVFIHRKTALTLLLIIACGTYHITHLFSCHTNKFTIAKQPGTIRIMGWNVQSFATREIYMDSLNSIRHRLFRYIQSQQPDIICIQDFLEYDNKALPSNIHMLADTLGYRYYFSSNDYVEYPPWGPAYSGIAIFSKYPLLHVQRIPYNGKKIPESILTADINIDNVKRRLIVTHLQSMHLRNSKSTNDPWNVAVEDSLLNYYGTVYEKLAFYLPYHAQQARLVRKVIDDSPWPVIFSADMNEVPASFCYHHIKGNLQDAFLKKGAGLGRTYTAISPTLRIDYLLASEGIEITQYLKDTVHLSDHYPQIMDVKW